MEEKVTLRESTVADAERLSHFFSSIPLHGKLDIKIKRHVDFFSLYRRLNINFHNYILEDTNSILGTASFLYYKALVNDHVTKIAFACDLRISPVRKAILNWSRHFLPRLQELSKKETIEHFISSINLDNTQVINSFIRTKQKRSKKPFYELIRKFNLITIHGFYPIYFTTNPHLKIRYLEKKNHPQFLEYLEKKLTSLDLVPKALKISVHDYIQESLIYSFSHFIIAYDQQENIVGCCYPLSSTLLQDYFPLKYSSQANNFRQFLKLASILNFGRKLTRPFSSSQKDQTLNFQFLHFLFFDHPDILKNLVHYAFQNSKNNDFLAYFTEQTNYTYRPPKGTIHTEMNFGLYEIRSPDSMEDTQHMSLKQKIKKNIWLDGILF